MQTAVLSYILGLLLCLTVATARRSLYVPNLKFSKPCENNKIDEATGNFKCMVTTGAECFKLCQAYGCYEWSFTSFMPSTSTRIHHHYRCRCAQNICLYNYVRAKDRDYTSGRGTTADRPTRACGFRAHLGQVTTTKVKNQRLPANPHSTSLVCNIAAPKGKTVFKANATLKFEPPEGWKSFSGNSPSASRGTSQGHVNHTSVDQKPRPS
uniref:Secreted protein n=1 Tax=Mesocestoides corti TaxID=53468 RepID=A0A5K3FC02_MESCO